MSSIMNNEEFMTAIRAWREAHPDRTEAYMSAIPKQVIDSMAFEGDYIDPSILGRSLDI